MDASHFTLVGMWEQMGWIAKAVVIILAAMSIWSLGFAIERLWRFRQAKKESLKVALGITPLLKQHKLTNHRLREGQAFSHSHLAGGPY